MKSATFKIIATAFIAIAATAAFGQTPSGYPAEYGTVVEAANKEGALRIYATTDEASARPLLDAFRAQYPQITIEYSNLNSTELYNRVVSEQAAGQPGADFIWSGGMDTTIRLAADGYALEYASPEIPNLPAWAAWKNMAYGTTAEPLVFMYNKRLLPGDAVPKSHADLVRLVKEKPDVFRGKVSTLDPSGTFGLVMNMYDQEHMPDFFDMIKTLGMNGMQLSKSSGGMMEKVRSGEYLLAWNLFGSYVALQMTKDENVGMILPADYTLVTSRIAFIGKTGEHPHAAKLFLDYALSAAGQEILANGAKLYAAREDVKSEYSGAGVRAAVGDAMKPLPLGEALIDRVMDPDARVAFIKQFQESVRGQ